MRISKAWMVEPGHKVVAIKTDDKGTNPVIVQWSSNGRGWETYAPQAKEERDHIAALKEVKKELYAIVDGKSPEALPDAIKIIENVIGEIGKGT